MSRFITTVPLPTSEQAELLVCLIEEASEVQHRATKLLRFGASEVQSGQDKDNTERLSEEVGEFIHLVERCLKACLLNQQAVLRGQGSKAARLDHWLQCQE